jgi:DNA-binding CsgD family transcriptional regulator
MNVPMTTLDRALTLVGDLAELDDPANFAGIALAGLSRLVGSDVLTFNEIGLHRDVRYTDFPHGALNDDTRDVFAAYVRQHPVINHYRATGDGQALRISDFLSPSEFHRLDLYAEFFRHVPTEHQLAVTLPGPATQVVGIAFNRARHEFTSTERDLVSALRAPLATAMLRTQARHRAQTTLAAINRDGLADLTGTETRVLGLVALGGTNVAIGHTLDVSPRTIAKHLEHIYRKLGVSNRAAAVARRTD